MRHFEKPRLPETPCDNCVEASRSSSDDEEDEEDEDDEDEAQLSLSHRRDRDDGEDGGTKAARVAVVVPRRRGAAMVAARVNARGLVARMGGSPRLTDRSFPDTPLRRNLR